MKRITAFILVTLMFASFAQNSIAREENISTQELIDIAKHAEKLYAMSSDEKSEYISFNGTPIYNDGSVIPYDPKIQDVIYPAGDKLNTMEKCEKEYRLCFTDDFVIAKNHLFLNTFFLINEDVYIQYCEGGRFVPQWETATFEIAEEGITMYLKSYSSVLHEFRNDTVTFVSTERGYRINGGSYFTEAYGYTDSMISPQSLPQTGDDVSIYILAAVLFSVLSYTLIMKRKKTCDQI